MNHLVAPINVFVVAPAMLCWGFERLVQTACPGVRLTGMAPTLDHALRTDGAAAADVLVIDHDEALDEAALASAASHHRVLLLTSTRGKPTLEQLRRLGARAAVRKSDAASVFLSTIRDVAADSGRTDPRAASPAMPAPAETAELPDDVRIGSLTARERELIVALLCNASASGKVIANSLAISEHTLRNHLTSIYAKLGVHSRLSLHAYAASHHLVNGEGSAPREK